MRPYDRGLGSGLLAAPEPHLDALETARVLAQPREIFAREFSQPFFNASRENLANIRKQRPKIGWHWLACPM
jgi:hypothetical protein